MMDKILDRGAEWLARPGRKRHLYAALLGGFLVYVVLGIGDTPWRRTFSGLLVIAVIMLVFILGRRVERIENRR